MITVDDLRAGAEDWLATAEESHAVRRYHVAFEAARQSAELAGKALLLRAMGRFPKERAKAGPLAQTHLLPPEVDGRELQKLLREFTLGTDGFDRAVDAAGVARAISTARAMVAALR